MEQQTKEWLEWRKQGIGSSDASVLMGTSPWSTPFKLWQEKLGLTAPKEANTYMKRGLDLESTARQWYQEKTGIEMPQAIVENKKYSFIRASLDGLNAKKALEIKCPGPKDHAVALMGKIPEKYRWQLHHQMLAADIDSVDYLSFDGKSGVIIPFHREEKPERELLGAEQEFWDMVQSKIAPPYADGDYREVTVKEMIDLCEAFKNNKLKLEAMEAEQDRIKKLLQQQAGKDPILCAGVAISTITRKGNVDYAKIPELKEVNLESYRKKPTIYVDIRVKKVKEVSDE